MSAADVGQTILGLIVLAVMVLMYFLPTAIAVVRKMPNAAPIAFINLLLGWTVIGWVAALIMASMQVHQPVIIRSENPK
jgi:hypothetical protein